MAEPVVTTKHEAKKSVLVIDDDPKMRELISDILEPFDFKVVHAESSEEGLTLALIATPDAVLCDLMLPDALGFETAKALGQYPATQNVPIIFITGYPYMEEYAINPNWRLLLKPFSMSTLVNTVRDAIASATPAA